MAVEEIAGFFTPFSVVPDTAVMDVDAASCQLHSTHGSPVDSPLRVHLLEACFFSEGRLKVSDVQEEPRCVRFTGVARCDMDNAVLTSICNPAVLYHRVSTKGDGSCALNAAFGLPSSRLPASAELVCEKARCAAVNVLRECRTDAYDNRFCNSATRIRMIWNELTFPCAKKALVPGTNVEDRAAKMFWKLLPHNLKLRAQNHIRNSVLYDAERKKCSLMF